MFPDVIILAGGFGTRLRKVIKETPKPMAPINGIPFLCYQINYLKEMGAKRIILSIGYLSESIKNYFKGEWKGIEIVYAEEKEALGTGGAIKFASTFVKTKQFFVTNGDTLFPIDLNKMQTLHEQNTAVFSLALRKIQNVSRYGVVKVNQHHTITEFAEKGSYVGEGNINGGVYLINKDFFSHPSFEEKFSLEKECFEKQYQLGIFKGFSFDNYFIDIGIPEDYERAQIELKDFLKIKMHIKDLHIDKSWTLFLDRDGVINHRIVGDYVRTVDQFEWIEKSAEAIAGLSQIFGRVLIVTNQQGVAKNLIKLPELEKIHNSIQEEIQLLGGKVNKIYVAPSLAHENCKMRKPNPGMARKAKVDFPEIDFSKSVMCGDSASDMEFGNKLGFINVYIQTDNLQPKGDFEIFDYHATLWNFYQSIIK